jgi:thioredoxin 1
LKILDKVEEFNVSSGLFAVKFTADWCGPCKKQQPNIDKMEQEFPDVQFLSVDIDLIPDFNEKYKVKSIPLLVLIKDGLEVKRITGVTLISGLRTSFIEFTK